MEEVKEYLTDIRTEEKAEDARVSSGNAVEKIKKDKQYLRNKKEKYRGFIEEGISIKNIRVRGYDTKEKMNEFIDDMVSELVGYSVLEQAFRDPKVSDIYVIDWNTIYVEKGGINERYPHSFRSAKHFEDVLKRLLDEAEKEINLGDSKIVDFELFQDRGCATSPSVSPRGYSLTIRKHAEDHITRDQLINYGVINEEISDFLGMLITGETNIICAGLTGSGKTTTVRALLDYYVPKANKRMLVCEDTQELFPKNEHTLELVSVKSDDVKLAVPLQNLIFTALRLKPKYIIVGEVRGIEAEAAVEGMETGHSTIMTMHGGNVWNVVNRLSTKYLMKMPSLGTDIVERIIGSGVDYVFIQDNIPGIGRKVTNITEVSYDFKEKRISAQTICKFDFETETWKWTGTVGEEKAEKMLRRGIKMSEIEKFNKMCQG